MCNQTVLLSALMAWSSLAVAQPAPAGGAKPLDGTCEFNFSSGSGRALTNYCVTKNGNIGQFSIGDSPSIEFIDSLGPASEGYGLCDSTSPFHLISYYDYARTTTSNWGAATATLKDPSTVEIDRTTKDGIWRLTQTVAQVKATATVYGAAKITMSLTNLSNHNRFAVLQRHVNIDAGGSSFNDFDNTAVSTTASVPGNWGFLTNGAFETSITDYNIAFNQSVPDGQDVCVLNTNVVQGFFQGDGASEQRFGVQVAAGQSKVAVVTYRPI